MANDAGMPQPAQDSNFAPTNVGVIPICGCQIGWRYVVVDYGLFPEFQCRCRRAPGQSLLFGPLGTPRAMAWVLPPETMPPNMLAAHEYRGPKKAQMAPDAEKLHGLPGPRDGNVPIGRPQRPDVPLAEVAGVVAIVLLIRTAIKARKRSRGNL